MTPGRVARCRAAWCVDVRWSPSRTSRSKIKRLRELAKPQYRLRLDDLRVFYDVDGRAVSVLSIVPKGRGGRMAGAPRSSIMRKEIVILRHGKPAGVLIGFRSEDDWFDYRVENDPRFLARIERARRSVREGQGVRMADVNRNGSRSNKRMQPARATSHARGGRRRARG